MNKVNITSVGSVQTYENDNKTPKHTSFKWDGNYDGQLANIDIRIDNNGKKNKTKLKFTNDDLIDMLSGPVDSNPIDERLMNDFLSDRSLLHPVMMSTQVLPQSNDIPVIFESDLAPLSTTMSSKTKKRRTKSKQHKNKNKSNKQKSKSKRKSK